MMDSLPVELIRLVYEYCEPESVRALRLVTPTLAEVGYEFLIAPKFTAVSWRDDIRRLLSISDSDRLRGCIESLTLNFAELHEYNARHASYFQHYLQEPEERSLVLADAWQLYSELEKRRKSVAPFDTRADAVKAAFSQLPNLRDLEVTFAQCPFDIDVMKEVFEVPNCRKMDHQQASKNLCVIVSAMRKTDITSFTVDRLPLDLFKGSHDRKQWFDSAEAFSKLTHLNLTLDTSVLVFPAAKFRAVNGLGYVLRLSPQLKSLSLAFQNYNRPQSKFILMLGGLLEHYRFGHLTDLKLEGICCAEDELRAFLLRHAETLERLRLGGRGLAKAYEAPCGGVELGRGSFRSLFTSLRGRLVKLQKLHLEGDFVCQHLDPILRERYDFHAITDDNWNEVTPSRITGLSGKTIDGSQFASFLLDGATYPGTQA